MKDPRNFALVLCSVFIIFVTYSIASGDLKWTNRQYVQREPWMDTIAAPVVDRRIAVYKDVFVLTTKDCVDAGLNILPACENGAILLPIHEDNLASPPPISPVYDICNAGVYRRIGDILGTLPSDANRALNQYINWIFNGCFAADPHFGQ